MRTIDTAETFVVFISQADQGLDLRSRIQLTYKSQASLSFQKSNLHIWGAKEAVAQWAILHSRKRPERVNRNK